MHAHRHHHQYLQQNDEVRLKKSVKFLEMNRQAYTEESKALLQKQVRVLESLRKEHNKLQAEVALEAKTASLKANAALAAKAKQQDRTTAARLKKQLERRSRQNMVTRKALASLQQHVNTLQAKQMLQRRALGGVDAPRTQDMAVAKRVHKLENQLEKTLGRLNKSLARHKDLKRVIDDLRRERLVFTKLQKKLQKELGEKQAKMAQVIEACNQAYETRDKAKEETNALSQANAKEILDNEAQLHELMRVLDAELRRSAMRPALLVGGRSTTGNGRRAAVSSASSPAQRRLSLLIAAEAKEERVRRKLEVKEMEEELERHNVFLNRIKVLTGYGDVEHLLAAYMFQEEQNFSLYTYVNQEQWREIKGLETQLAEYQVDLELVLAMEGREAKEGGGEREVDGFGNKDNVHEEVGNGDDSECIRHHNPTSSTSSALSTQLESLNKAILFYENKGYDAQSTLDILRQGITSLATAIHVPGGAKEEIADMSEGSLLPCLARIERRMEEIFQATKIANCEKAKAAQQRQQLQHQQQHSPQTSPSSMSKVLRLMVDPVIAIATDAGEDDDNAEAVRLEDGMAAAGAGGIHRRFHDQVTFPQKGHQNHIQAPRVNDYSSDEEEQNGSSSEEGNRHDHQQPILGTSPPSTPPPTPSPTPSPHMQVRTPPRPLTRAQVEKMLKRSGTRMVEASAAGVRAGARLTFADNSTSLESSLSTLPSMPSGPIRKPRRMSHFLKTFED